MPVIYSIDKERKQVTTTASAVITLADVLMNQEKLSKDPDFDPSYSQLLDMTQVTEWKVGSADVRKMAQANIFSPRARRAVVVRTDEAFGLARMFESFREAMGGKLPIRIFRDLDDALHWLHLDDTADSPVPLP